MSRIILFDLDGTLIDSTEAILESFNYAFRYFEVATPSDDIIKAEIGYPLDVMFVSLGIADEMKWDFVTKYKEHYQKISRAKTYLLLDAKEAIKRASKIANLGVVTTKTGSYSIELLEHLGLMEYFRVVIGREDVTHPKPHPQPIQKALLAFEDSNISECWMVGDTCMDMESASSANIKSVGVTCGYCSLEQLSKCTKNIRKSALEAVDFITSQALNID
jgi:phosphoglycolate phosphatase